MRFTSSSASYGLPLTRPAHLSVVPTTPRADRRGDSAGKGTGSGHVTSDRSDATTSTTMTKKLVDAQMAGAPWRRAPTTPAPAHLHTAVPRSRDVTLFAYSCSHGGRRCSWYHLSAKSLSNHMLAVRLPRVSCRHLLPVSAVRYHRRRSLMRGVLFSDKVAGDDNKFLP